MSEQPRIPHSLSLEQAVISGLMADADGWDIISHVLSDEDFYSPRHRTIFGAIRTLYCANKPVDVLLVAEWLENNDKLNKAGGKEYLGQILCDSPATTANIEIYAGRVREFSVERQLLAAADSIKENIMDGNGKSTIELLEEAEKQILAISNHKSGIGQEIETKTCVPLFDDVFRRMDEAMNRKEGELSGVKTGLIGVDKFTDGFQKKQLIFIGARPSMGKTTLGMNFVESAMFCQKLPVVVFSMESPSHEIGQRLLSSMTKVPMARLIRAQLDDREFANVTATTTRLKNQKLIICDKGQLSPSDMRSVLRRIVREHGGIGLIMADYVQKMKLKGNHKKNRNEELCEISADLKEIAKEFDCPFIALAQLSKLCESRPDKRPMMSDLRDCGGFEQDADVVIMLYRDEVYKKTTDNAGLAELIFRKNRNGAADTVITRFNGSIFRFSDNYQGYGDEE